MRTKNKVLLFFLLVLVMGTSCGKDDKASESTVEDTTPEVIHTTFLLFKEEENIEGQSADGVSIGSLYIKKENEDIELIDKDVFDSAVYDNETEEVLYLDNDSNLYKFVSLDEKSIFIDENVEAMYFADTEDQKIVYTTENDSVYVYSNSETEKIGSNVNQFEVINNDVYYNTKDNNLVIYNMDTREEKRIANNVDHFIFLDDPSEILYLSENQALYYLDDFDTESVQISSGPVSLWDVIRVDDEIYYSEYAEGKNKLYLGSLSENTRPEMITDDVQEFRLHQNDIYYLTTDSILYKLEDQDRSKRIAFDVLGFDLGPEQLIYLNDEYTLYSWESETEETSTVGYDVSSYAMFSGGELYYLNDDNELFKNSTKLASDIYYYSAFHDTLAYANKNSLYLIHNQEESTILEDSLDEYSVIYYQNYPVFENRLTLSDISGFWKFSPEEDLMTYIEVKSNGTWIAHHPEYEDGEYKYNLEIIYSGYNKLDLFAEELEEYISFYQEDGQLALEIDEGYYPLEVSSWNEYLEWVEDYDQQIKEEEKLAEEAERLAEEEQEFSAAEYVVEGFITSLSEAVNYGEYYLISQYIDPASSFYEEQSAFVWNLYERNIEEYLYNYEILHSKMNENQSITVETRESFDIYDYEKYEERRTTYKATYSLVKKNGEYLITDLFVEFN